MANFLEIPFSLETTVPVEEKGTKTERNVVIPVKEATLSVAIRAGGKGSTTVFSTRTGGAPVVSPQTNEKGQAPFWLQEGNYTLTFAGGSPSIAPVSYDWDAVSPKALEPLESKIAAVEGLDTSTGLSVGTLKIKGITLPTYNEPEGTFQGLVKWESTKGGEIAQVFGARETGRKDIFVRSIAETGDTESASFFQALKGSTFAQLYAVTGGAPTSTYINAEAHQGAATATRTLIDANGNSSYVQALNGGKTRLVTGEATATWTDNRLTVVVQPNLGVQPIFAIATQFTNNFQAGNWYNIIYDGWQNNGTLITFFFQSLVGTLTGQSKIQWLAIG